MTATFRKAYSVLGALLLFEILAQFYVIATSMFTGLGKEMDYARTGVTTVPVPHEVDPYAAAHAVSGLFIIPPTILILIGLSFGARYPWKTTGLTAGLFLLVVIQLLLGVVGFFGFAAVAGLHGLNAVLVLGLAAYLVVRNWAFGRRAAAD